MRTDIEKEIDKELYNQIYKLGQEHERKRIIKEIKKINNFRSAKIDNLTELSFTWNAGMEQAASKIEALIVHLKRDNIEI